MVGISNTDFATVRRLLAEFGRVEGNDTKTKELRRRAILLARKFEKKNNKNNR